MTLVLNGTTGVSAVDGSASTPAIQGNDTNTGVFFPAADTVAVATGGSERVRVDSSGNVGVGTSSPGTKLEINTGSSYSGVRLKGTSSASTGFEMTLGSNGKTGYLWNYENDSLLFATNNTERARIESSGNFLHAKTSTSGTARGSWFDVVGALVEDQPAGAQAVYFRNSNTAADTGNITVNTSTTSYNTSSDYRLKHDIAPMTGALEKVAALKPVTYKWKVDDSEGEGFIAHELAEICPGAVTGEKDAVDAEGKPVYQGIDTSFLVATLTAAIQELNAKVESLTAEIATLKGAQA